MTVMINTLEFAEAFEQAGFDHEKAKALASAFARAHNAGREDLTTKTDLALLKSELLQAMAAQHASLTKAIADNGKELSGRLWTATTIVGGVAAAIASVVSLIFKSQGL